MILNLGFLEAITELVTPSRESSPLQSPSILRRETRTGISKFGLEYVAESVDDVLQKQIGRISKHRMQSGRFYDRLAKQDTPHEYSDLDPKTLLRIIGSYVRKSELKDKHDDHTRLSAIEAYELEKLYEFIKTEDGRQLLHEGIVDVMGIESEILSSEDNNKLSGLQFSSFRGDLLDLVEKVRRIASFTDSVAESWKSTDEYVQYIRNILIGYYQQEAEFATKSIEGCEKLMTRKGYSLSYKKGDELFGYYDQFMRTQHSAYARFHELNREASANALNKVKTVTIVVRK